MSQWLERSSIVDGEEIVVDTTEEKVLVPADSNRQVVIKLVPRAKTYHCSVKYIPELFFVPFRSRKIVRLLSWNFYLLKFKEN